MFKKISVSHGLKLRLSMGIILSVLILTLTSTLISHVFLQDKFVPTPNGFGWMNHYLDPITHMFLEEYPQNASPPVVLEIGAGNASASLEGLRRGAFVWVNDLSEDHVREFVQNARDQSLANYRLLIGDFLQELDLPLNHFDRVLAIRVLHFFNPVKLEQAISKMFAILKPGGKVYIVVATPYMNAWKAFQPVFEQRRRAGDPYPGYVSHISEFNSQFQTLLPEEMHFFDPEILKREFKKAGFHVTYADFIPEDTRLLKKLTSDRGLVGLVGEKPHP